MTDFLDIVRKRADLASTRDAQETAEAVLHALAESISHGEAADLAGPLSDDLAAELLEPERARAEPPSRDEFLARIAERLDVGPDEALARSQAVMAALTEVVGEDEVEDARAQLPPEYESVFQPGESLGGESFAEAVQSRSDLDSRREALRATEATLETLGQRLSKGEAEDVAEYLPDEAADWLVPETPPRARDIDFDEFVQTVANQENVSDDRALEHIEAVTDVLAETVGEEEFERMEAQLPETYDPLFEPAT